MSGHAAFGRLLRLIGVEKRAYGIGLIFVVISAATSLAYPQAIRLIIDEGVQTRNLARINELALIMLGLLVAEDIAVCVRNSLFNAAADRVTADLRQQTFDGLLVQEIAFFDRNSTGEITARLAADTAYLTALLGEDLADVLRVGLWAIGGTVLLFYTSALLAAVVLLSVPPLILAGYLLGRRVKRFASDAQAAYSTAGTVAEEAISGIRTVRGFSQEAAESARHRRTLSTALAAGRRKIMAGTMVTGFLYLVGESGALLAIWIGGHLIVAGRLTTGALISFILYAFLVARGFRNVSTFLAHLLRTLGATDWLFTVLDRVPELPVDGGGRLDRIDGRIAFERLRFAYPTRPDVAVLDDVSLTIAPGEVVAFVGRSGAGKSTILNLLLRFYDPTGGRVRVDGRDVRDLDAAWLRDQIGLVLQEPTLFSRSVSDNLRYGRANASELEINAAVEVACARGFIAQFPQGYATQIGDRGVQLSGGQRQRLAIARAVVKKPAILLLDEATSALDAESELMVHQALSRLSHRPTTLIVAHRLSTVVNVDRVIVIDNGRIVAAGTHDRLLQTSEFYRQLVETQLVPQ